MSEKGVIFNKIILGGVMILAFLIPLFFLPFTYDLYEFNKNTLLSVVCCLLLIFWLLKMALEKKITFQRTPLDLPILVFAGTFLLSTIFVSTNKWESFWTPGATGTIISLVILYFIITNNIKKIDLSKIIKTLAVSASLLGLLTIYQFVILKIPSLNQITFLKGFSPAGGLVPLATFLAIVSTIIGTQLYFDWKTKKYDVFILLFCLAGLGLTIFQLLTTSKSFFLPYQTAWAIAIETLKQGKSFFFGVGPTSFMDAFSQSRPATYNLTNLWSIRFGFSSNYYFHLLTTVGVLGLGAFVWLIWKVVNNSHLNNPASHLSLLISLVILLFVPANFLLLFTLFILLALFASDLPTKEYIENSKITPWVVFAVISLAVLGNFYLVGRVYAADVYFKLSLKAMARNDGTATYNNQIQATTLNPFDDFYHLAYSQTNLALAYSLASKANISDQDRQNITILVQQAIREAKTAVNLNKNKVTNWENLASIYRQLINFAQGADQWTITALTQAIKLDPTNPNLRLTMGGIYYALKNYDQAIRFFQQTVELKPDFANGYYNLAAAYREKGDFQSAHDAMQMALNLVPTTSEDYTKARGELDELAKKIPAKEATGGAETKTQPQPIPTQQPLVEPQPYPSPVITPPIEIPQEQAAPEISPAPPATP